MATSQFTYYSSADAGGPGLINGVAGSLIPILRACLVNGYPGKAAAGWTEPIAATSNRAAFKQGTGSCGFHLFVNDNAPGTYAFEANITGWEAMLTLDAPVGTGTGQFPLPAQQNATGYECMTKSNGNSATLRSWRLYADSRTFYWFCDYAGVGELEPTIFGDIFSLNGISDAYRCFLYSRYQVGSPSYSYNYFGYWNALAYAVNGHWMARALGGAGGSVQTGKHPGDGGCFSSNYITGQLACPNPADNAIWLTPLYISDPASSSKRGRLRGLWVALHPATNFADGQTMSGAGELAGKTFQCVRNCVAPTGVAMPLFVETSNTVETN